MSEPTTRTAGRPEATTPVAIEQAAFELFAERGFEATTLDAIAEAVGVSRRTLFRYYASKNDIPWGQFDRTLDGFRQILASMPSSMPVRVAVQRAVVAFNDFPSDVSPPHHERMRLILGTPALQAHSVLRYKEWRAVVSEYVADRLELPVDDVLPRTVGHVSLAIALSAYESWLERPAASLPQMLDDAMDALERHLQSH